MSKTFVHSFIKYFKTFQSIYIYIYIKHWYNPIWVISVVFVCVTDAVSINPILLWEKNVNVVDMDYLQNGQLVVCTTNSICLYDEKESRIPHYLRDISIGDQLCAVSASRKWNKFAALENGGWRPSHLHV